VQLIVIFIDLIQNVISYTIIQLHLKLGYWEEQKQYLYGLTQKPKHKLSFTNSLTISWAYNASLRLRIALKPL